MSIPADGVPGATDRHLNARIVVGLVLGTVAGVVANAWWAGHPLLNGIVTYIAQPVGQIFLRFLLMVVVPLVFTTVVLGVVGIGDLGHLGKLGIRTLAFFLGTTLFASALGLGLVLLVAPGAAIDASFRGTLIETFATRAAETVATAGTDLGVETLINIVPRNPLAAAVRGDLIAFIFFALVFAVAMLRARQHVDPLIRVLESIERTIMIMVDMAMRMAPIGVAGLAFAVTARLGLGILAPLGWYVATVLLGLAVYQFGVLGVVVRVAGKRPPLIFFRDIRLPMLTAFSTASSSATLPATIRTAEEELGIPRTVSGFVLPLGATLNMNGTAFFATVTVVFLAQTFGISLPPGTLGMIVVLTALSAVSAAGIPSGSIPLIVVILEAVGIPGEAIALIFGVEPLLGMARTSTNVTGDLCAALVLARGRAGRPTDVSEPAP